MNLQDALNSGVVSMLCNIPDLSGGQTVCVPKDELLEIINRSDTEKELMIAVAAYSYFPGEIDWQEIMQPAQQNGELF